MADTLLAGTHAGQRVQALLLPGETLSTAAIWADCAKGFLYCHRSLTPEMQAFVDANPRHHNYHYTDVPFEGTQYVAGAVGTDPDDVVQIIGQAINVLSGTTAASNPHGFTQRHALLLLAHLVGDIHQPLHVGTAYINNTDDFVVPQSAADLQSGTIHATHGDNYLMKGSQPLHAYWDSNLVERGMRRAHMTTPQDYAVFLLQQSPEDAAGQGDVATWPVQWANEVLQLAKEAHRGMVVGEHEEVQDHHTSSLHFQWPVTLPSDYAKRSTNAAEQQLVKAGKRLANLLKTIWP
jgi:S1/P1 Nuclease